MAAPSFIFSNDPRTGALTPEQLKKQRAIADALFRDAAGDQPHDLGSGLASIGKAIAARVAMGRADKTDAAADEMRKGALDDLSRGMDSALAYSPAGAAADGRYTAADVGAPAAPLSTKPGDENIYSDFIGGVKGGGLTNPYGLAAVAATGKAESGYSAGNAYRQWSDPSESGQAGMAGGIMSWRAGRLQAMRDFAAQNGDDPNRPSAKTQAAFFLAEDPGLVQRLNSAKSVEEAQSLMNNAWAFAGHDRPGGEAARRLSTAQSYLPSFMGGPEASAAPAPAGQPVQVASLDPSIGMDSALAYDPRRAAGAPAVNPQRVAAALAAGSVQPAGPSQKDRRIVAALGGQSDIPPSVQQASADRLSRNVATGGPRSMAVQAALDADPNFDGFARSGSPYTGPNAPSTPAAPGTSQPSAPAAPAGGYDPRTLMSVIANPWATDDQRQVATFMLKDQMSRRDLAEKRAFEQNDPDNVLKRQYMQAQIDALGDKGRGFRTLTAEQAAAMGLPAGGAYQIGPDGKVDAIGTGKGQQINVNTGSDSSKFYEDADKARGKSFNDMADAGAAAQRSMIQIDELEGNLANVGTGGLAAMKQLAGRWGLPVGDLSDIQAATALINRMIPEQRPPGSGSMSDGDVAMFRQSLPSIINQPGGNALIIRTMRGIAQYDAARGELANRVLDREITPAEGRKQMAALPNPLAEFRKIAPSRGDAPAPAGTEGRLAPETAQPAAASAIGGNWPQGGQAARPRSDAEFNALPKGALYIDPDDGKTYRK